MKNDRDSFLLTTATISHEAQNTRYRRELIDTKVLIRGIILNVGSGCSNETKLASSCNRLGPSLNLKLGEDSLVVSFYGDQSQKKPLADLLI